MWGENPTSEHLCNDVKFSLLIRYPSVKQTRIFPQLYNYTVRKKRNTHFWLHHPSSKVCVVSRVEKDGQTLSFSQTNIIFTCGKENYKHSIKT